MPKWHKIRRKKPVFGAILCQNGTRLMPKWHSQNACMSIFLPLVAKRRGSGEKRGCASPLLGMVLQQAATMAAATRGYDGFSHLAGNLSTLVTKDVPALATVHLSDWGVVQKCTLQPCALVCMTNKPFSPLLGKHRHKWRWGIRRDYAHKWARSSPVHWGNCCGQLQRTDSLYKMPEPPHATGSDLARCGTPDSTKCTRQPRRLDDKPPTRAPAEKSNSYWRG